MSHAIGAESTTIHQSRITAGNYSYLSELFDCFCCSYEARVLMLREGYPFSYAKGGCLSATLTASLEASLLLVDGSHDLISFSY